MLVQVIDHPFSSLDPKSERIRVSAKCSSQLKKGNDVPIEVNLDDIKCIRKEGDVICQWFQHTFVLS